MEDTRQVESKRSSIERERASTSRVLPAMLESASPGKPKLSPEEMDDVNQEWEVRKIIGKEYVDGVLHYLVEWCPTLEPEHSLGHAAGLVDKFESRLRVHCGAKSGRGAWV